MTIPVHPDLLVALDAVAIASPTRYTFLGHPRDVPASADGQRLSAALESDLYERLYTRPPARFNSPPADELARRDHLAACSASNSGTGTWEPGWTVRQVDDDGQVSVSKDGLTFWVPPSGLRSEADPPQTGATCRVRVGKELRNLIPGFYVAIGNGDGDAAGEADDGPLVRYYWHLTAPCSAPFLREATARLNAAAIPFRAKVLADLAGYRRADAGVLYLARRNHARAAPVLAAIHAAIAADLRPEVPLFTRPLAEGLGVAEDPGDHLSFGEHRCRLVARALWRSFSQGDPTPADRAATLVSAFADAGLDPIRPHLDPGSRHDYSLRPPAELPR